MKLKMIVLLAIGIATMSFSNLGNLSGADRKYALTYLTETQNDLLKKVKGLSPEQLNFKADSSSWSVAQCVEHIALAENNMFEYTETALKTPADASKRSEVKMTDEALIAMITDRSTKRSAPETYKPSGKFGSYEATLAEFKAKRASHLNFIKTTSEDLRNHYYDFPFGKIDAYQTILFMAGHSRRHTMQIEEILKNANFPKK